MTYFVRRYYDDTEMISHYQIFLPHQLLNEFLHSLHGQSAKHPGITKMIQEARQKYYYPLPCQAHQELGITVPGVCTE